jgi:murein tripeptide amidase MpaA
MLHVALSTMPTLEFNQYLRPHEVEAALQAFAEAYPALCDLQRIGTSHAGRPIWCLALTNKATGPDREKPALWLDANIHATEVTGCMGALHLIQRVLTAYGAEERLTHLLDTRAMYVVPCLNPDGMEQALTSPLYVRSGTRRYPYEEEREGLYPEDLDGDGLILQMRVQDPDGGWKVSDKDARLMRRRGPDELGGTYYRIFTEGRIRAYDGYSIKIAPPAQGLDFNRNFPYIWAPEGEQRGAGPFPTSEPEVRAAVEFLTSHLNVCCATTYHTFSGVILRPYSDRPDEQMPVDDLWTFQEIGRRGKELTGYPDVSVFHGFRYHPREVMNGAFDDWAYESLGLYAFTVELWDIVAAAGVKERDFIAWFRDHPEEDDLKLLAWNDEQLGGRGFVPWRPFDHPQLGPVDLGGWIERRTFGNPPEHLLLETIAPVSEFVIAQALMSPRLELRRLSADALGEGVYRVRAVAANSGYLPTYGSKRAQAIHAVRPIALTLELPAGAELVSGERFQEIGQLEGRANKRGLFGGNFPTDNLHKLEWVVRAPHGGTLRITAASQRAGTARAELELG